MKIIKVPEDAATLAEAYAKLPQEGGEIQVADGYCGEYAENPANIAIIFHGRATLTQPS